MKAKEMSSKTKNKEKSRTKSITGFLGSLHRRSKRGKDKEQNTSNSKCTASKDNCNISSNNETEEEKDILEPYKNAVGVHVICEENEPKQPLSSNAPTTDKETLKENQTISPPLVSIKLINNNSKTVILNTFKTSFDSTSLPTTPTFKRATASKDTLDVSHIFKTDQTSKYSPQNKFKIENRTLTQLSSISIHTVDKAVNLELKASKDGYYIAKRNFQELNKTTNPKMNGSGLQETTAKDENITGHVDSSNIEEHQNNDKSDDQYEKFDLNMLDVTITLGTGTFGRVFLAEEKSGVGIYAMKIMRMKDIIKLNQVEHVNSEREVLKSTHHPFIIECYWTYHDEKCLYMLMEYVPGGELFTYLRSQGRFSASDALFYVAEIISVLGYLHEKDIVYRDLKPENLLLDNEGHLKFTDFGFSKILHDTTWTLCGTPEYLSPEAIQGKGHDTTCDWWALGILTYELLVGEAPFVDDHPFGLYEKILACHIIWPSFVKGTEQQDFIKKLVVVDRSKRLGKGQNGTEDVKSHLWLRYINWEDVYNKKLKPPIKPKVAFQSDTSNFDDFDEDWEVKRMHDVTVTERDNFKTWNSSMKEL